MPAPVAGPPAAPIEPIPPSNIASTRPADPHGFSAVAQAIPSGTQKRAKAAVVAAVLSLDMGEQVQAMIAGEYLAHDGVAVLTDRRIIFANSRTFAPEVDSIPLASLRDVKGWAEGGRATLRVVGDDHMLVIGDVREVDAAQAFAAAVRARLR